MAGEDRRNPDARMLTPAPGTNVTSQCTATVVGGIGSNTLGIVAYGAPDDVSGWIHRDSDFDTVGTNAAALVVNAVLQLGGMTDGPFRVEYWDTVKGEPVQEQSVTSAAGLLRVAIPPFARDIAVKVKQKKE